MKKARIPIIVTSLTLSLLLMAGYLLISKDPPDKDIPIHKEKDVAAASTVTQGAISIPVDNSSNYTYIPPTYEYDDNDEADYEEENMQNPEPTKTPWTPATEMDLDPASITVFVNKEYCLPKDYVPENLVIPNIAFDISGNSERKHMRVEAAIAIEKLFAAALDDGIVLYGISGYRSYERQKEIFLNNIVHKGKKHTLKYSAVPGTSEHQTGLAMDVSAKSVRYKLVTSFAKSKEGLWLADNAHRFGFIIRYPKDHYETTGYAYEPWHIRYVGKDLANYLYTNNLTLDEYYNYKPSEGFNFEELYADLINYEPPVTPTPIPEEELAEQELTDQLDDENTEDDILEDEDLADDDTEDEALDEDFPEDSALDKGEADKEASNKDDSDNKASDSKAEGKSPGNEDSDGKSPNKEGLESKSPDNGTSNDKNPDTGVYDSRNTGNGAPENKSPDNRASENSSSDGNNPGSIDSMSEFTDSSASEDKDMY